VGLFRGDEAALKREALAQQALEAALSLLKNKAPERPLAPEPFEMPIKADGQFRIGLMLPFSGDYAALGRDIASGAELALFQLASSNATLVYFDTAGGSRAAAAAREAVAAQVDIVIGPLFTKSAMQTRTIFAGSAIPAYFPVQ
jgi:outer membrane PBP1 activator LpoA protein